MFGVKLPRRTQDIQIFHNFKPTFSHICRVVQVHVARESVIRRQTGTPRLQLFFPPKLRHPRRTFAANPERSFPLRPRNFSVLWEAKTPSGSRLPRTRALTSPRTPLRLLTAVKSEEIRCETAVLLYGLPLRVFGQCLELHTGV